MESLKCTNIPGGEELASRFMTGADSNLYSQCIWDLKNSNRLNPLIGMPDNVEKAYEHLINHCSSSSMVRNRNGGLSFHMGSQQSGGKAKKKNKKNLSDEELAELKRKSTCRYCDKKGHWADECRKKKNDESKGVSNGSTGSNGKKGKAKPKPVDE